MRAVSLFALLIVTACSEPAPGALDGLAPPLELGAAHEARAESGAAPDAGRKPDAAPAAQRVLFVAIDSLDPAYLELDAAAAGPGSEGNWLLPNLRAFLKGAAFWPKARAHAPYATDMNHLNILAGTSSGLTGVIGVSKQVSGWGLLGAQLSETHLSKARYPDGQPVQTLFQLLKQAAPSSKTAFLSNKGWVAEMYTPGAADLIVTGADRPAYVPAPTFVNWHDNPASDPDAACDPESAKQTTTLELLSKLNPAEHPRDAWIVDAALEVLKREKPDLAYILLGDLDHGQHFLGTAVRPEEFEPLAGYAPPQGCSAKPGWSLVSRRNPALFKEPILDLLRDVDLAFGKLSAGLAAAGYADASVVLVSDHGMTNHLYRDGIEAATDLNKLLGDAGLAPQGSFYNYGASSIAALFWRPLHVKQNPDVAAKAKALLLASERLAPNPETGKLELPWDVLDRAEMIKGRPDLGIAPMELYHAYFAAQGAWPELVVLCRNGWSIPSGAYNVGGGGKVKLVFNAGHGAPDTAPVTVALRGLGHAPGARCADPARLADVGATVAKALGLAFPQSVGAPLACSP